jgi:thiol-disulfide isomerase/thioredoxin
MSNGIQYNLFTLQDFKHALASNPGVFIMKMGATWCGPCRQVEPLIKSAMEQAPPNVQCAMVDIDESVEIYGFLKAKKMVGGVPVILVYYKDNLNYIPDDIVVGADANQIAALFARNYRIAATMT